MASQTSVFREKVDLKGPTLTLLEGTAFGGVLFAGDLIDDEMNNDKESFRSASTLIPLTTAVASWISAMVTKGTAHKASRDLQLMSTPVAILQVARIIKRKDLFAKIFKKKANSVSDHFRSNESRHGGTEITGPTGLVDVTGSEIGMLG